MRPAAPAPSCCAGLRPALLNGWRQSFPVHPAPFHQVAAQCGGTWREVLQQCQRLQHSGSLQALQARWGTALQRVHWRLGLAPSPTDPAGLARVASTLAVHTACVRLSQWQPTAPWPAGLPTLWVDLVGRDAAALAGVLKTWRDDGLIAPDPRVLALRQPEAPCDCPQCAGPCEDAELAQALEDGLPLVAHPYAALAARLKRPERRVLARLHAWQRQGSLQAMGLAAPWLGTTLGGAVALLRGPLPHPERLEALRAQPSVSEVQALPMAPDWPWPLWVGVQAPHDRALGLLRAALQAVDLAGPDVLALVDTRWPRPQPALFPRSA